jgi:hypothetical protein
VGLRQHGWAGLSIAALGTLSVALAVALVVSPGRTGEFHGLGRAPLGNPGLARLVVQFAPETTESEMRRILRLSQTRLVDGPTGTDAYLLAVDPAAEREALRVLRSQKAVVLVESLDLREQP